MTDSTPAGPKDWIPAFAGMTVRPASLRPDLTPVFSFNGEGLWSGVGATTAGNPLVRLSLWRDLLAKAKAEGF